MARARKPVTHMWHNALQGWVEVTIKGSLKNLIADYKAVRKAVKALQPNAQVNTPSHSFDCDAMKDSYTFRITVYDTAALAWLKRFDAEGTAVFAGPTPSPSV